MKKYIITGQELKTLIWSMVSGDHDNNGENILYALKPIEPLSDEDIDRMWYEATAGRMHIKLARAVERHIFGEAP